MTTATPSEGDAQPQVDLRKAMAAAVPILAGLLIAEIVFEAVRARGRGLGRRHPLLSELTRVRP